MSEQSLMISLPPSRSVSLNKLIANELTWTHTETIGPFHISSSGFLNMEHLRSITGFQPGTYSLSFNVYAGQEYSISNPQGKVSVYRILRAADGILWAPMNYKTNKGSINEIPILTFRAIPPPDEDWDDPVEIPFLPGSKVVCNTREGMWSVEYLRQDS